jgi:4-hydroxy-tetrahydrodipicolinate reductase
MTSPLKVTIIGATGRMGSLIAREAAPDRFEVVGAVAGGRDPSLGKTLKEIGTSGSSARISPPPQLEGYLRKSDVCISFTNAQAEVSNIAAVASAGVPYVSGTTGLTPQQRKEVETALVGKLPAVIASNFSVGANFLIAISSTLKALPRGYDVSIVEAHHSGKADAPSGTALSLANEVAMARGYSKTVSGRSGISKRDSDELEVTSLRGGGTPGIHTVHAFGPHEMITLEHLAFSRSAFALGALHAAEWVSEAGREARIYGMADVLGLRV